MVEELDSQYAEVVRDVERMGVPEWSSLAVDSARRLEDELFSPPPEDRPPVETVREFAIDGPGGDLPVRAYRPEEESPFPTLVYYHGGGWVLGTLDSIDGVCRRLARRVGCLVLSVDYRLAPEHPFPAAVDDAWAALEWAADHAGTLGGDPERLGVAGTSAGGNLAAVTALRAREDDPDLSVQALCYPILDREFGTDSYREHADGPLLTRADMEWFWDNYLRSPVNAYNPMAAPLRAGDLSGVAPAIVLTAGHDVLREEGRAYADRLGDVDALDSHFHYPSMGHGFLSLTGEVDVAAGALSDLVGALEGTLGA